MKRISTVCAVVLLAAAAERAWAQPTPELAPSAAPRVAVDPGSGCAADVCYESHPRVWASAEYILWWSEGQFVPPLLTTSPPGTPLGVAGVLGQPGTAVLFGDRRYNAGARSGARVRLGIWLNQELTTGVEGSFFALEDEHTNFARTSFGDPILARPFVNALTGLPSALPIALPGLVAGAVSISAGTSALFGTDVNLRRNVRCGGCGRLDLLGGFRFLGFDDNLEFFSTQFDAQTGARVDALDRFHTFNRFYGGQFGAVAEWRRDRWLFETRATIAVGATAESADVIGLSSANGAAPVLGGVLAVASNSGHHEHAAFAFLPEGAVTVGYQVTRRIFVSAGYTILYLTNVARAGEQVNLTINPNQFQPPVAGGPLAPPFAMNQGGFWAQGLSLGLQFRF